MPDGSKEESWWSMRFCHRIDALAIDHCEDVFEYRPKPEQYPNLYYYRSNEDNRMRLAVHKDRIAGKAIWYDWRFKHDFCSQELGQFFIDNGIRGYRLKLEDDLMRSNHVIGV